MDFQMPGQVRWDDMLLCDNFYQKDILKFQAMELEPTDVVVASYPKTGTTVMQEIVWLIRNNGDVDKAKQTVNIDRVPYTEFGWRDNFAIFNNLQHPRHVKTHCPYRLLPKAVHEGRTKVVYVTRNPRDCLVSFYHFYLNSLMGNFPGSWDDFFEYFKKNDFLLLYGNPLDHMVGYWQHRNDKNVHIVSYENIVKRPKSTVIELAQFLECDLTDDVVERIVQATSFGVMKDNPMTNMTVGNLKYEKCPFMRKGKVGDWKNFFNDEQNRIMREMEVKKLSGTGLEFEYE